MVVTRNRSYGGIIGVIVIILAVIGLLALL